MAFNGNKVIECVALLSFVISQKIGKWKKSEAGALCLPRYSPLFWSIFL